ncbi:hypothetical protein [Streptomyces griseofuscus]|uniref:Uncharacterized protein n=1 Tax=Streptomyces griseofuscus TaxID=146922 RepID=A0A3R8Q689_9ACTN|nr:hypothetical protein [Streptomyces griseofuscus]RRQ81558.1 hypothetical protein CQW44_30630 [Streptomyces griseofuscus]
MRVRVLENFQTYFNYEIHRLESGIEYAGEFARHLASSGCPVEVLEEDPAPEPPTESGTSGASDAEARPGGDGDPGTGGAPQAVASGAAPDGLDIDGTIDTVLGWVGEDDDRARVALELEKAKGEKARATLLKRLEALAGVDE